MNRVRVLRSLRLCLPVILLGCSALNQTNPFSQSHEWFGEGLPRLAKVSDCLYTGAQPSSEGFAKLKQMGIRTVVNVRESESSNKRDKKACEQLGLGYVLLPIPSGGPLSDETVAKFFQIVCDDQRTPVFVHCLTGRDRVVTLAALYRIAEDNWTADQAYEEMLRREFNATLLDLSQYVYDFEKRCRGKGGPIGSASRHGAGANFP